MLAAVRERVGGWISGKKRAVPSAMDFQPFFSASFGPGIGAQPTHEALLRESKGVADMATRAIANRIASLEPLVKMSRRDSNGTLVDEELDDHPLKVLLDRPHPNLSRSQMMRLTAQHILTVGEAYWLKVGSRLGVPIELHPVPPVNIWPVVSRGSVSQYGIRDAYGREQFLNSRDVVRFYFPDPENIFGSEGYLGPAGITADSLKFSGEHLRRHYESDATPKTALKALPDAVPFASDVERERFYAVWRRKYSSRSGSQTGIPFILPPGYDLIQFMLQSGADIVPLLDHWRDEQLMGFGVPRSVLGQVVSGDRSSAETNQYVFDLHTITPITTMISETLSLQLAPDFDGGLFVDFGDFVSVDKTYELAREAQDLTLKIKSIQQVIEDRGGDPEGAPWGELPVGSFADSPYTGEESEPSFSEDDDDAFGDEPDIDDEPRKRLASNVYFTPGREWKRVLARERAYTPRFEREMRSIFDAQRKVALELLHKKNRAMVTASAEDLLKNLDWDAVFKTKLGKVRKAAYLASAREAMIGLQMKGKFEMTKQIISSLRKQDIKLARKVNGTTIDRLREELAEATSLGEGIDGFSRRVNKVFKGRRRNSLTIARTELLTATQQAQTEGFRQSGVVEWKQWNDAQDDHVRDSHIASEIEVVGLDDSFVLANGATADFPGDSTLDAADRINCRCFVTPVFEDPEEK